MSTGAARFDFTDAVVLVTGASGGIGQAIARRFAAAGAHVAVHFHANRARAKMLADELDGMAFGADLGDDGQCVALLDAVAGALGPVDVLVNNAGAQPVAPFAAISGADFRAMLDANLGGPFALIREIVRAERPAGIINIASIEGLQPAAGHSHYAASKAGLLMLTRAAALELGPRGIRVNAVSPGLICREGLADAWPEGVARWQQAAPLSRLGTPEDVADAVLFLASDAARWITGANLVVDGGMTSTPNW